MAPSIALKNPFLLFLLAMARGTGEEDATDKTSSRNLIGDITGIAEGFGRSGAMDADF